MRWYLLVLVVAGGVSFWLTYLVLKLATRFRLYPEIRDRDVHSRPTPRLGGVAMFVGVLAAFGIASQVDYFDLVFADSGPIWAILGAALLIVVVGVLDDIFDLDWMIKLAAQIMAGVILAWQGVQILSLPLGDQRTIGSPLMGLVITILAVVLTMNAVNFIDGLDGLVAGVSVIANSVFFVYSYLVNGGDLLLGAPLAQATARNDVFSLASLISITLVGVSAGFLPFNWRPAKIFMGDSGAMLVGLLMATSALALTGQVDAASLGNSQLLPAFIPILLPFAILVLPFLDFSLAVIRRLRAGKSPFAADRLHLHHRLLDMGHGHVMSVFIFYAWTAVISGSTLLLFVLRPYSWALLVLGVGIAGCLVLTFWPMMVRGTHRMRARRRRAKRTTAPTPPPTQRPTAPQEAR